jgi:hypothetical protein
MATVGLKGLWGLEQLDKTGIATWKLGLILMGVAGVVGYILTKLLIGMEPNSVYEPMPPNEITGVTFGLVFMGTLLVVFLLALARAIEVDLRILASFDDAIDASIERLRPKRALRITCVTIGLLFGFLLFPALSVGGPQHDFTLVEASIAYAAGGPQLICYLILVPIVGLISGMCWAVVFSQIISLIHAARHIKIDFLQLNDYAAIANAGVRLFLCLIPMISLFPLMMLYVDDSKFSAVVMQLLLIMAFFIVSFLLLYAYPIWMLRNRIRDKKLAEMDQITQALRGDKEAVKTINIHALDAPTTAADLLTHRMFLDSLWDWPIASHLQKLILFGLLPPLTWVVAAMIENAMY